MIFFQGNLKRNALQVSNVLSLTPSVSPRATSVTCARRVVVAAAMLYTVRRAPRSGFLPLSTNELGDVAAHAVIPPVSPLSGFVGFGGLVHVLLLNNTPAFGCPLRAYSYFELRSCWSSYIGRVDLAPSGGVQGNNCLPFRRRLSPQHAPSRRSIFTVGCVAGLQQREQITRSCCFHKKYDMSLRGSTPV